jgi:ABC-type lipoprotein release transport system permease subunit
MLYQSSPAEPMIFAVVLAVLSLTALAAALLPAVRAARVEPATALRRN